SGAVVSVADVTLIVWFTTWSCVLFEASVACAVVIVQVPLALYWGTAKDNWNHASFTFPPTRESLQKSTGKLCPLLSVTSTVTSQPNGSKPLPPMSVVWTSTTTLRDPA